MGTAERQFSLRMTAVGRAGASMTRDEKWLRGTLSAAELYKIRTRMDKGQLSKAQRKDPDEHVALIPNSE